LTGPVGPLVAIEGAPPRLGRMPAGCPFSPRCPRVEAICEREMPALASAGQRRLACWRPE
jgi:oligopeptide/dipeptide ABC transporter ATP-binding protein